MLLHVNAHLSQFSILWSKIVPNVHISVLIVQVINKIVFNVLLIDYKISLYVIVLKAFGMIYKIKTHNVKNVVKNVLLV
jgi:hypothetical protein